MQKNLETSKQGRNTDEESGLVSDVLQHAAYSAFQKPLTGVSQLVDATFGSRLTSSTELVSAPRQASFGSARWHAEQIADGIGSFVPLIASAAISRPVSKLLFEKGMLPTSEAPIASLLERHNFAEGALTGFTNGVLFQPSEKNNSPLPDRLRSGLTGAVTFGTMQAASARLGQITGASSYESSVLNKMVTTGIAGVGGGITGATTDSLLHGKIPELKELASSAYSSAFTGAMLGGLTGNFTKMQTRDSEVSSVQEFLARKYEPTDAQGDYQFWLENQKLSVQLGHIPALVADARNARITVASTPDTVAETVLPTIDNSLKRAADTTHEVTEKASNTASAMEKRYRSQQLSELSPLERLQRLEQYEKAGKTWTLNDKSLGDMHDILSTVEKSWDEKLLTKLTAQRDAARVAYEQSGETDFNARLDIKASQNAITEELAARGEQITNALKPWFQENSMPELKVRFADLKHGAQYGAGEGTITLDNSTFMQYGLKARGFGLLYHEIVHGQQDMMGVGLIADKLNIGKVATPEQLDQIKSEFEPRWKQHGVSPEDGMAFIQQVLEIRNGRRFSESETKNAQKMIDAYDNYDGNFDQISDRINSHISNTSLAASAPIDMFAFLRNVAVHPDEVKSQYGFETLPDGLLRLSREVDEGNKAVPFGITDSIAGETRQLLTAHIAELNRAHRRAVEDGNDKYFGSSLEAQAYPAGIIAELFAKSREHSQANPA